MRTRATTTGRGRARAWRRRSAGREATTRTPVHAIAVGSAARRHLRALGFEVEDVVGASAALGRLMAAPQYDVVLLDLRMPDGDGPTFLHALRRHARYAATRVVLTPPHRYGAGEIDTLHADAFLHTPFEALDLGRCLERLGALPPRSAIVCGA